MQELFEAYLAKFGAPPPERSCDAEAVLREGMQQALDTGRPWVRSEDDQEGVTE